MKNAVLFRKPAFTTTLCVALLTFSAAAIAQTAQSSGQSGRQSSPATRPNTAGHSPWKFYPTDRAVGDGGPAPKRDLTGTWAGPGSGMAVPRGTNVESPTAPPLTPLGQPLCSK